MFNVAAQYCDGSISLGHFTDYHAAMRSFQALVVEPRTIEVEINNRSAVLVIWSLYPEAIRA